MSDPSIDRQRRMAQTIRLIVTRREQAPRSPKMERALKRLIWRYSQMMQRETEMESRTFRHKEGIVDKKDESLEGQEEWPEAELAAEAEVAELDVIEGSEPEEPPVLRVESEPAVLEAPTIDLASQESGVEEPMAEGQSEAGTEERVTPDLQPEDVEPHKEPASEMEESEPEEIPAFDIEIEPEEAPAEAPSEPEAPSEAEEPAPAERRPPPPELEYLPPPDRFGCLRLLLTGLASAIAGALLAVLVLWIINGTLDYRSAITQAVRGEAFRLEGEMQTLGTDISQLRSQVEAMQDIAAQLQQTQADVQGLQEGLVSLQAEQEWMGDQLANAETSLTMLRDDVNGVQEELLTLHIQIGALQDQLGALSKELRALRQATQRFDAFLAGLRNLLSEPPEPAQGLAPTPLAPETVTSTPSAPVTVIPRPAVTVIPLATPTPVP